MPEVDLSEFRTEPRKCPVGRALDDMAEQDRVNFTAALALHSGDDRISNRKIMDVFGTKGFRISKDTVASHRLGKCTCG